MIVVEKFRESDIELYFVRCAREAGAMAPKFVSPARRSVPDRLLLKAIPLEHREIVARYFRFVELKATGQKPSAAQEREHQRLRALGYRVDVIDNKGASKALFTETAK